MTNEPNGWPKGTEAWACAEDAAYQAHNMRHTYCPDADAAELRAMRKSARRRAIFRDYVAIGLTLAGAVLAGCVMALIYLEAFTSQGF